MKKPKIQFIAGLAVGIIISFLTIDLRCLVIEDLSKKEAMQQKSIDRPVAIPKFKLSALTEEIDAIEQREALFARLAVIPINQGSN